VRLQSTSTDRPKHRLADELTPPCQPWPPCWPPSLPPAATSTTADS
jgi:hypothetical protein